MARIQVKDLTFYYEGSYDEIFKHVNFEIDGNWKLGFCGRNGRGKTTFLKLLMGLHEHRGTIKSDMDFDYFPFEVAQPDQPVLEVILAIAPTAETWEIYKDLSKMGMHESVAEQYFSTLSSGEKTKVLLIALFLKENNFLLIDEPTNHLDLEGRQLVANFLRRKQGFILVSHDRAFLDKCTDYTLSINKTNIEIVKGSFSSWWEQTARRELHEAAENEKLAEEIIQMEKTVKRNKFWASSLTGTYNANASHGRCPSSREARLQKDALRKEKQVLDNIEEKKKLLQNVETIEALELAPLDFESENVLELDHIQVSYQNRQIIDDFNLTIHRGQRLALVGKNGSGKSSLLRLICGELKDYAGTIQASPDLKISYVPQEAGFLNGTLADFAYSYSLDLEHFQAILFKLDFSAEQLEKDLSHFSDGQKKKVLIAKSLAEQAHLYIWDEPLNYIDVYSRMQIEQLILEYEPTLLFVEHDAGFIENVATGVVRL